MRKTTDNSKMGGCATLLGFCRCSLVILVTMSIALCHVVRSFTFSRNHLPRKLLASGYDETDKASKGLVSSLTTLVNSLSSRSSTQQQTQILNETRTSPRTPQELLSRIRQDYTERNYLWTGDIDLLCFDQDCCFTDPTLSFNGTDTFVRNLQNLRPLVDAITTECRSDLLSICLSDDYIQTRWNMVGDLGRLPWKPRVDVVGRTKFWFQQSGGEEEYRVILYDEEWEIPAWKALLQLVTPAGTMPNSTIGRS